MKHVCPFDPRSPQGKGLLILEEKYETLECLCLANEGTLGQAYQQAKARIHLNGYFHSANR